jgi:lysophospholipase L1-like esterase
MLEGRLGLGRAEVVNSGLAGDATYPRPSDRLPGAANRVRRDVLAHEPDIAVVLIGGNDRLRDEQDRRRTLENLVSIAERIREADVRVLLLQYAPALGDPDNPQAAWTHIDDKNPLIAEAARRTGSELLDLGAPLTAAARRHARTELVNAVDGIHLNPRGEMVYARAIFRKLDELGWLAEAR